MYHTMDPAYSALYRMNPLPNNTLATAELNQRGLFPTGNQRADVAGPYPADIRMARKNTAECNRTVGGCGSGCGCRGAGSAGNACSSCCPGFKQTPWDELVGRRVCSACTTPATEPRMADGGLGTMSSFEVQQYDARNGFGCSGCALGWGEAMNCPQGPSSCYARDNARCCTPMSTIVARSGCSANTNNGVRDGRATPYPMFNFNNDDAGMFGGYTGFGGDFAMPPRPLQPVATENSAAQVTANAGKPGAAPILAAAPVATAKPLSPAVKMAMEMPANQAPSNRVEPVNPMSPLVKAKDVNDVGARVEADAINLTRCQKALADARAVATQAAQGAQALRDLAGKAASTGQMGVAAAKQAQSDKMVSAARQSTQMANYAQTAANEATKAANNGDSKALADAANASIQAASSAIETASNALGASGTASAGVVAANGYMW